MPSFNHIKQYYHLSPSKAVTLLFITITLIYRFRSQLISQLYQRRTVLVLAAVEHALL